MILLMILLINKYKNTNQSVLKSSSLCSLESDLANSLNFFSSLFSPATLFDSTIFSSEQNNQQSVIPFS